MNLKDLSKEIPYKWRVQSFSKFKPSAQCVAYIDARDVMDLLDKVCGADNWQDEYVVIHNHLFARIGINVGEDKAVNWVWKGDCGIESNIEKEKGESSDAFKRAGVKWSIGRFLYRLKTVKVASSEKKADNNRPFVVDGAGKRVWDLTKYINDLNGRPPVKKEEPKGASPRKQPEEPKKKPPVKPPAKPVKENEGDKLYISPVDKKTMITKQRFIDIIFCNAKKYNIKTDKIINTVYNSKEPIDMQPGQLQTFWGIVKNQIEEQIKALKEK